MQVSLLTTQILLAIAQVASYQIPDWLEGLWDRDDVYVMDPSQPGDANDGLTAETSWPNILRYPLRARASATYPSPNGTKAYPNGVKVIVFLPGDYSMRKMHSVRVEEYWPHWDSAADVGLESSEADPLILVYASEYGNTSSFFVHPRDRRDSIAEFSTFRFSSATHGVKVHGLCSLGTYSGFDFQGSTDGRVERCWIETDQASAIRRRNGAHRNYTYQNYGERRYPWSALNDYAGLYLSDGPNEDCTDKGNVMINFADGMQGACRGGLYRQDPITIDIDVAGTGYIVGDALSFGTGTAVVYRHAVGTVTAVDGGGGITEVTCTDQGAYSGGFPSITVTSSGGSGATLTCTALAGPTIAFGDDLVAPDIYEQGWYQNTGYGGLAGYLCEDNWFGYTSAVQNSNVYNTIGGIENCIDLKTGGTLASPAVFRNNKLFGLRANAWSPTAAYTLHDVTSHVQVEGDIIVDCSSVFNLNAQYFNDRTPNDPGSTGGSSYPAWESFTTCTFTNLIISDIEDFATTASWPDEQGRICYNSNSFTFQDNDIAFSPYWAADARDPSAAAFVYGSNRAHAPFTTAPGDWTDGTISSGYQETTTVYEVPWTDGLTISVRQMVPV